MHHLTNKEANVLRAAHNLVVIFDNKDCGPNARNLARMALVLALEDAGGDELSIPADARTKLNAARYETLRDVPAHYLGTAGVPCIALPASKNSGAYATGADADRIVDEYMAAVGAEVAA